MNSQDNTAARQKFVLALKVIIIRYTKKFATRLTNSPMRHAIAEAAHDHQSYDDGNRRSEESIQRETTLIKIVCISLVELFVTSRQDVNGAIAGLLICVDHCPEGVLWATVSLTLVLLTYYVLRHASTVPTFVMAPPLLLLSRLPLSELHIRRGAQLFYLTHVTPTQRSLPGSSQSSTHERKRPVPVECPMRLEL
jgi:hypothetical protein